MAPKKRTTRASPAITTTTTSVTNAQLKALIDKGVADAFAVRDANRSMIGDESRNSGTGVKRNERVVRDTVGHDVAYAMTWEDLKKKMTDKYCPRGEIKKLEVDVELEKSNKTERYVSGLPDMIHRSVVASKPKIMQEGIEMATELMDKKIHTFAERQTENKRKQDDNNNQAQQQPPKKQGIAIAYTAGSGERKEIPAATNNQRTPTCYECRNQVHYRSDCPKLKNQNHENQTGGTGAREMVNALGGGEINQDLNNVEDDTNA
ncbi:hypothetical protein Tco_1016356 [Tanacetum coccineum]|uniref:CCHC-type domain-containing protein n=1 Tax=Tanacetum coccineum TaxID=301880 RepID=A0ABQ5FNH8_9ASTR